MLNSIRQCEQNMKRPVSFAANKRDEWQRNKVPKMSAVADLSCEGEV